MDKGKKSSVRHQRNPRELHNERKKKRQKERKKKERQTGMPGWQIAEGHRNPKLHYFRKMLQSCGSKKRAIIMFQPTKLLPTHRVHIRFND
jgi:carbonic anhydrase